MDVLLSLPYVVWAVGFGLLALGFCVKLGFLGLILSLLFCVAEIAFQEELLNHFNLNDGHDSRVFLIVFIAVSVVFVIRAVGLVFLQGGYRVLQKTVRKQSFEFNFDNLKLKPVHSFSQQCVALRFTDGVFSNAPDCPESNRVDMSDFRKNKSVSFAKNGVTIDVFDVLIESETGSDILNYVSTVQTFSAVALEGQVLWLFFKYDEIKNLKRISFKTKEPVSVEVMYGYTNQTLSEFPLRYLFQW